MQPRPEIPVRSFSVSVVLLRFESDGCKVLLLRRTGKLAGEWCQIAGSVEEGETAWQAALRETREETGLVPDAFYSGDICEQFYEADHDLIAILPVFVGYVSEEQTVKLNPEHDDFLWTTFEEARGKVPFAGQKQLLDHVRREFAEQEPNVWLKINVES